MVKAAAVYGCRESSTPCFTKEDHTEEMKDGNEIFEGVKRSRKPIDSGETPREKFNRANVSPDRSSSKICRGMKTRERGSGKRVPMHTDEMHDRLCGKRIENP